MNLCLRPKAVEVISTTENVQAPAIPDDAGLRGRAAELHRQLSHMNEPIVVPRDQLVINLDFDDVALLDELPPRVALQARPTLPYTLAVPACMSVREDAPAPAAAAAAAAAGAPTASLEQPGAGSAAAAAAAAVPGVEGSRDAPTGASAVTPAGGGPTDTPGVGASAGGLDDLNPAGAATATTTATGSTTSITQAGGGAAAAAAHARGFVRVKSGRPPHGLSWTHSRKCLEVLIAAEQGKRSSGYLQSQEQRLRDRLERLNLEMVIVAGDGNCQFRSISNELYGTQDHHTAIRRQAVAHILEQRPAFEVFLGEDFDQYVRQMERNGTWGDELTLRAVCDSFGLTVHVVTSEEDHWYLTYQPETRKLDREIFLTYIAPIHYNSIRRRSSLKTMALSMSRSFKKIGSGTLSLPPGGPASGPTSPTSPTSPRGGVGRPLQHAPGPEGSGDGEAGSPGSQPVRLRLPAPGGNEYGGRDGGGDGGGGGGGAWGAAR